MAKTEGNERQLESQMLGIEVNSRTGLVVAKHQGLLLTWPWKSLRALASRKRVSSCGVECHVFVGANRREISLHLSRPALGEDSICCRGQIFLCPTGISVLE